MNRPLLSIALMFCGVTIAHDRAYASESRWDVHQNSHHVNDDELACYRLGEPFENERLKINVKPHSRLTEKEEERRFGHPKQVAFSVHGKEVGGCGPNTILASTGTVIVAESKRGVDRGSGSHMGLEAHASRVVDVEEVCRSVTFECTSNEPSPTPDTWLCVVRNDFGIFKGTLTLTKVDESQDPRCSLFEDGGTDNARAAKTSGSATGLR